MTPGSTVRLLPPARSSAGSPGSRKNRKNRNDRARNTVGMISNTRRMMYEVMCSQLRAVRGRPSGPPRTCAPRLLLGDRDLFPQDQTKVGLGEVGNRLRVVDVVAPVPVD